MDGKNNSIILEELDLEHDVDMNKEWWICLKQLTTHYIKVVPLATFKQSYYFLI
jgi:hypothetical protein